MGTRILLRIQRGGTGKIGDLPSQTDAPSLPVKNDSFLSQRKGFKNYPCNKNVYKHLYVYIWFRLYKCLDVGTWSLITWLTLLGQVTYWWLVTCLRKPQRLTFLHRNQVRPTDFRLGSIHRLQVELHELCSCGPNSVSVHILWVELDSCAKRRASVVSVLV